tara:strand:- start:417 stop:620 length:204 start_codon:yes stop_codon:yes gene_type:complete
MTEVTLEEFESNYEKYMDLIESGKQFIIRKPDGGAVAAVPAKDLDPSTEHMSDDEWYNSFHNHDDAS